jgi:hypothetical protein
MMLHTYTYQVRPKDKDWPGSQAMLKLQLCLHSQNHYHTSCLANGNALQFAVIISNPRYLCALYFALFYFEERDHEDFCNIKMLLAQAVKGTFCWSQKSPSQSIPTGPCFLPWQRSRWEIYLSMSFSWEAAVLRGSSSTTPHPTSPRLARTAVVDCGCRGAMRAYGSIRVGREKLADHWHGHHWHCNKNYIEILYMLPYYTLH